MYVYTRTFTFSSEGVVIVPQCTSTNKGAIVAGNAVSTEDDTVVVAILICKKNVTKK